MRTLDRIRKILLNHKDELRRKYKVKEIGIFGSFIRGEQKKNRDIMRFCWFAKWQGDPVIPTPNAY